MSGKNGDKARFNRMRKQKIDRRAKQRLLSGNLPSEPGPSVSRSQVKSREKLA